LRISDCGLGEWRCAQADLEIERRARSKTSGAQRDFQTIRNPQFPVNLPQKFARSWLIFG
jgi:hypothetical protein